MARPGRPSILLATVAVAVAVCACVVDTAVPSSNTSDAGGTVTDGNIDAGTSTDAGTGSDAGVDAGTSSPADAGMAPDAGSQSGGVGTGPSAECAGLLPSSTGDMHVYSRPYDTSRGSCGDAQGDATGVMTLLVTDIEHPTWRFVSSSGSDLGGLAAYRAEMFAQPFLASGKYTSFKEFAEVKSRHMTFYGRDNNSTIVTNTDPQTGDITYTVDPDGSGLRRVTANGGSGAYQADWSPNGARIAYASDQSGRSEIWLVAAPIRAARIRSCRKP